ncbi:MAG: NADPH-dependent glutamate synthase [Oscillospiraceae bacterium]
MPNMDLKKTPAVEQDPIVRRSNFKEVSQGYTTFEMAKNEAERCVSCKNMPCVSGCPVNVRIPEFIQSIKNGKIAEAYTVLRSTNSLPAICGRVCPQESQCEAKCVRGVKGEPVGIGRLERYVADWAMDEENRGKIATAEIAKSKGKKVAVVGSGPAGLTCAGDLAKLGYEVTIFEALHTPGGVLVYGIPEFRLPKALVRAEIATVEALGVKIETNAVIGRIASLDELLEEQGFDAVFIGSGAGLPNFQNIPGENLNGVYSANEFLTRINLMKAYEFPKAETPIRIGENVAIIGGGNVAMDAARCAKRLGAENVYIVYRRSEVELPARSEEVHHAKEEGIIFLFLCNPTRINGDEIGEVISMECVEMELGEPDASGRRRPIVKQGSEFILDVQTVVVAIGNSPNPLIKNTTPGLMTQKWGGIIVEEETGATSKPKAFAGGDAVTGAATVILAMGAGKKAAKAINEMLK